MKPVMSSDVVTPAVRAALLAALDAPTHTLRRTRSGFVCGSAAPVSRRCANGLERDGLFRFDDPACPGAITLTREGLVAARQLRSDKAHP